MLPVLLLATLAHAGAPYKGAGKATVSGVSELTLYAPPGPVKIGWFVELKAGEKALLVRLASGGRGPDGYPLALTEGDAKKLGLKPSGPEGKKTAAFKDLALGDVKVSGTAVIVTGGAYSSTLDIGAFPDLAWAIEPATGKVKVGPSGAGSVAEAVGKGAAYTQVGKFQQVVGKGKPDTIWARTLVVDATISGVGMPADLKLGGWSKVATEVDGADWFKVAGVENPKYPLPAFDGLMIGEREYEWREVGVVGQQAATRLWRAGTGLTYRFESPAAVGFDVLGRYDIGLDAGLQTVALRPHAGAVRASYVDIREAELRKPVDTPPAEGTDADAAKKALAGALAPLVQFLVATNQGAEAVEAGKRLSDAAPERCSSWHDYGRALFLAGDYAGAATALRKAGELYQPWAVRPLAERTALAANEAARSKRADFDGVWSQPHSCYTAWSELGEALLASGNPAAVAELYPKYADLDSALPRVAGNALLIQGNLAGAEAAYRQAVQLSYSSDGFARGGMMLATRERSPELALSQFQGNIDEEHGTLRYFLVYGEILRAQGGTKAIDGLTAWVTKDPASIPGWLALANEQAAASVSNSASLAKAAALLDVELALTDAPALHGWRGEQLRLAGKLPEAAAEAEKAIAGDPLNGLGYFVRARVAHSAGDTARAAELYKKAGQVGAADPLYATLLSAR